MVAKTYQSWKQISPPFEEKGRMYILVQKPGTGASKKVRWYSDAEYSKMYAADPVEPTGNTNHRKILGFGDAGYITIFRGYTDDLEWWFDRSVARFHRIWGWYIVSDDIVPIDLPATVEPVRLDWTLVGTGVSLINEEGVRAAVNNLLYGVSNSAYQGQVGDRLDLTLTVIASKKAETKYGHVTEHIFEDSEGNHYLWNTSAKSWNVGDVKTLRGSVKEHKIINNIQTTVLTRCNEV